jgi:hypothetical protein
MKKILAAALIASLVSACGNDHPPAQQVYQQPYQQQQQYPQQAPVQYAQPHDSGIGTGTAVLGAAAIGTAAYLAGKNAGEKSAPTQTTQVYRPTTTISQPAPVRAPVQAPVAQYQPRPQPTMPAAAPAAPAFKPQAARTMSTVKAPSSGSMSFSRRK